MNLTEVYRAYAGSDPGRGKVRSLLDQTHWFTINADFDPKTGDALPQSLSGFLARVSRPKPEVKLHDRLWRITEHARPSIDRIFRSLSENPRREQALLPIRSVKELDVRSFISLSKRPGRNIREKLAGRPYLHAVRRFQSVNLPENRLLKAFVTRLVELLELRHDILGEKEDELVPRIQSWLQCDEVKSIARWDNTPPNNTLLSHRDYRRVWDAWRWLQTIEDDIAHDLTQHHFRAETMRVWNEYGRMHSDGKHCFADVPVFFDYEAFTVQPWVSQIAIRKAAKRLARGESSKEFSVPACVDLSILHPCFAIDAESSMSLSESFLWQQWNKDEKAFDLELFDSDALYLHPEATSIAASDLFFKKEKDHYTFDRAARAFATRLRDSFKHDKLLWLVPDYLNDFELEVIRRNLNALFPYAEPLPRSIAAAFQQIDHSILENGFSTVVVDCIGGRTSATKLIATFDQDLKKILPETKGFYYERCPSVIVSSKKTESTVDPDNLNYGILAVDEKGQWCEADQSSKAERIEIDSIKGDPRIGDFSLCIRISESPVRGGIRLNRLQNRTAKIPLWRDQIPELSIKVYKDGYYQRFSLVSRGTTVKPIRGMPVQIPVEEEFILPQGKRFYEFPLFQGENAEELGFHARLDSPAFPLKKESHCRLQLTFEYGSDEPYKLVFIPNDNSFRPVSATWQPNKDIVITDAPAPKYPKPLTWDALRNWIDAQGNSANLLDWLNESLSRLNDKIPVCCKIRIESIWKPKRDNNNIEYWFAFAKDEDGRECYCNTNRIINMHGVNPNTAFPIGTELYCKIISRKSGLAAVDISTEENMVFSVETKNTILRFRERSLQNRMSIIWADARSLRDSSCPDGFATLFNRHISSLLKKLPQDLVAEKILFLLACVHKDTTEECTHWITEQVEKGVIDDPRAVGFALGDVSEEWQKHIFERLSSKPNAEAISVFAYAIWREEHFVERFSVLELKAIMNRLCNLLNSIDLKIVRNQMKNKNKWVRRSWLRSTAELLELLLGLLRTRDSADTEIKMLLQPHQSITKELAKQVERITEILAKSKVNLYSRVQLDLAKPEGDRTPDLLYALRLYLTGDDGANAIYITGVSDNDED